MGKIVIVPELEARHLARIRDAAPGWELIAGKSAPGFMEHAKEAEIIGGWNRDVREAVLRPGTALKWVQNWSAGVDSLPLDRFKELGIALTSASGVHPYPISETIFAMILGFARQIHVAVRHQTVRRWGQYGAMAEIHGRTIGILGAGAIGVETAKVAKAFGMRVIGVRRSGEPAEWIDEMYGMDGLNELLGRSDYIVNCLPHTPETFHLIGEEQFAAMKDGAFYVNIGRGKTTDSDALLAALRSGKLAGAGLDVFEQEPLPAEHPFWAMENIILTPHNAGSTTAYSDRVIDIFADNLKAYLQHGAPAVNVVQIDIGY
ncbi:D-2-hydroxyacid dehydrogenase [Paenibacillus humicola]|uniref:D-2-hydroxyacid dehydrogenase n=1 Tax=Paenibacillus humicola TaxID=3110540 RepID=UPI00237B6405|nr:D-2-hydroxyacid dehydrogenase [Paenibacillus humicola]